MGRSLREEITSGNKRIQGCVSDGMDGWKDRRMNGQMGGWRD